MHLDITHTNMAGRGFLCRWVMWSWVSTPFKCCGMPDWEASDRRVYDLVYISCLSPGNGLWEISLLQGIDMIMPKIYPHI